MAFKKFFTDFKRMKLDLLGASAFTLGIAALILVGSASAVSIENGDHSPEPEPNETVSNQIVEFTAVNVSGDGNTDELRVRFPNDLAPNVSLNQASVEGASITSSAELVQGQDNDTVVDTARLAVSPDTSGNVSLNVSVDFSASYPSEPQDFPVVAEVEDSEFGLVSQQVTLISTEEDAGDDSDTDQESENETNSTNQEDEDQETRESDSNESNETSDETSEETSDQENDSEDQNESASSEPSADGDQENSSGSPPEQAQDQNRADQAENPGSNPDSKKGPSDQGKQSMPAPVQDLISALTGLF